MQNHGRNPKKVNDIFKKELRHLWGCQFPRPSKHRYQMCELAIPTRTADEPIKTTNQRHVKHEVNSPPLEFLVWQVQRLQEASWHGIDIFDALANHASLDKCCNMLRQLRPPEALLQCGNGFPHTQVCRMLGSVRVLFW